MKKLFNSFEEKLWLQAVENKSFKCLLNHPKLLYYWQKFFPDDSIKIAKIQGHRIGKHTICADKCQEIENWLIKQNAYTKSIDRERFKNGDRLI